MLKKQKILVLDILNHPTFSFEENIITSLKKAGALHIDLINPIKDGFPEFEFILKEYMGMIILGSITPYWTNIPWINSLKILINSLKSDENIPILAICMSHELIASMYGGKVREPIKQKELGTIKLNLTQKGKESPLFLNFPEKFNMLAAHSRDVIKPPIGAEILAYNTRCKYQAFKLNNIYSIQFHVDADAFTLQRWIMEHGSVEELIIQGFIEKKEDINHFMCKNIYDTPYRIKLFKNFISICKIHLEN